MTTAMTRPPQTRPDAISVTVRQASEMVGLGLTLMYELLATGKIESRYQGRKRLVLVDSLRAYIDGLPTEPPDAA